MSPKFAALVASPVPWLPHPINATPGRSLEDGAAEVVSAAASSRSRNQNGKPVAAAASEQRCRKARREICKGFAGDGECRGGGVGGGIVGQNGGRGAVGRPGRL